MIDEKLNLCDFLDDIIKEQCPVHPGIYQLKFNARIQSLFWTVSNRIQCIITTNIFHRVSIIVN